MTLPQTHTHPNPIKTLAPHLLPHLPYSLPLLRRLQFHHSPSSARTIATFPPNASPSPPFSASYVDRTRAPETECWVFSTYEIPPSQAELSNDGCSPQRQQQHEQQTQDERSADAAKAQLVALLYAVSQLPNATPLMVIGTFAETLLPLLGSEGLKPQKVVSRVFRDDPDAADSSGHGEQIRVLNGISGPYMKWLIPPPSPPSPSQTSPSLPPPYTFTPLLRSDLALTISRTEIPHTESTLSQLGNIGIRYRPASFSPSTTTTTTTTAEPENRDGDLIAWAFITPDGSLGSLHVEPAHRGLGLAKAVSRRLFAELAVKPMGMGFRPLDAGFGGGGGGVGNEGGRDMNEGARGDPSAGWAHSDVAVENLESAGVVKGLGGREGWLVRWVSVDLGGVERAVGEMKGVS